MKESGAKQRDRNPMVYLLSCLILITRHNPRCFAYFVPFKLHRKHLRQVLGSPHFPDEKTKAEKLRDLPKTTELKSDGPVAGSQAHTLGCMLCLQGCPSEKKQVARQSPARNTRAVGPAWKAPRRRKREEGGPRRSHLKRGLTLAFTQYVQT